MYLNTKLTSIKQVEEKAALQSLYTYEAKMWELEQDPVIQLLVEGKVFHDCQVPWLCYDIIFQLKP